MHANTVEAGIKSDSSTFTESTARMASEPISAQMSRPLRVLWFWAPTLVLGAILMLLDADSAFTIRDGLSCLLMSSVVSLLSLRVNRRHAAGVALALLAPFISFGLVRFAYWPPRKELLHALESVQAGMTSTELRHTMRQFSEGTSWPSLDGGGELVLEGAVVFRAEGQTSDWAVIYLDGGVVTRVDFWPD